MSRGHTKELDGSFERSCSTLSLHVTSLIVRHPHPRDYRERHVGSCEMHKCTNLDISSANCAHGSTWHPFDPTCTKTWRLNMIVIDVHSAPLTQVTRALSSMLSTLSLTFSPESAPLLVPFLFIVQTSSKNKGSKGFLTLALTKELINPQSVIDGQSRQQRKTMRVSHYTKATTNVVAQLWGKAFAL